uniref:Uncharacterized protein n=1 Tax=Anopheles epiroticus TaxID=199890 RepID=A0A182P4R7_9DIPT
MGIFLPTVRLCFSPGRVSSRICFTIDRHVLITCFSITCTGLAIVSACSSSACIKSLGSSSTVASRSIELPDTGRPLTKATATSSTSTLYDRIIAVTQNTGLWSLEPSSPCRRTHRSPPPYDTCWTHSECLLKRAEACVRVLNLIIDAIVQSRRNSQKYARKTRSEKRSEPRLRQTRWALARINEFDDGGKTFEIMKPLDGTEEGLPGTVPLTDTEIVFAVLQNGNTLTYRAHRPQPAEQSR